MGDHIPIFWARVWYNIQVLVQEILDCTLKLKWLLCLKTFQLLSRSINSIKHIITITQSANLVALYLKCLHLAERSQARYFLIKHGSFVHIIGGGNVSSLLNGFGGKGHKRHSWIWEIPVVGNQRHVPMTKYIMIFTQYEYCSTKVAIELNLKRRALFI